MFRWMGKILDRLFVVAGALLFLQLPLFMQQYRLQLTGHVAELKLQVTAMQQRAQMTGKTLEQFIQKFQNSSDADFAHQGQIMTNMVDRMHDLSDGLFALDHASVLSRPFQFLAHFHYDIVRSTMRTFEMGITFTLEGLVYALAGMIIGYLIFLAVSRLCFSIYTQCSSKKKSVLKSDLHT